VHVIGPVVGEGAETLREVLELESHAATTALNVDLSAVTHLASSGVRVIQQFRRHMQGQGVDVELIAPPDSAAGHVLTLVGIPHLAESPGQAG
jgi:ABC-type transporter Mla MlaB component